MKIVTDTVAQKSSAVIRMPNQKKMSIASDS